MRPVFTLKSLFARCLLLWCGLCWGTGAGAQSLSLQLQPLDKDTTFVQEMLDYQTEFAERAQLLDELQFVLQQLYQNAYLEASVDSLFVDIEESKYQAFLHIGERYQWAVLENGNVEERYLSKAGFREKLYQRTPLQFSQIETLQDELLAFAENSGYPFAKVWLDDIVIQNQNVSAKLFMEKGQLVLFDELQLEGKANISKQYLANYLGIKPDDPYDKSKILKIRDRIRELPFLNETKNALVTFAGERAIPTLFLERQQASRFDFIVGFLPNSSNVGNGQVRRFLLTGSFTGEMQNQFGLGERIFAEFEQLRPQTQELNLAFNYPFVLDLPFGIDTKFHLYKRDTSFLDVEYDLGIQYLLEGNDYIKAFWNNRSSTLLTVDEARILQTRELPNTLDVTNATFGLEYLQQQLDYRFNPRKGWQALIRGGAGIKRIKPNNQILALSDENFDFAKLYDTLNLRTFQYRLETELAGYIPLFKRATFKIGIDGGFIFSEQPIYRNEQFRIGGNRLLRGFDEEQLFATQYAVLTLEPRLLIGQNSYLYAFLDYAWLNDQTTEIDRQDYPLGFGSGLTFETKVGVFGISLAVGRERGNPIDFRSPKIHLGYVSLF